MNDEKTLIYGVDDHPMNRRLLLAILRRLGYEGLVVESGQALREALKVEVPALILMDLRMPDEDGFAVTRWLKANPPTAEIPVVAFTADLVRACREDALAAGCDDFVGKPIDIKALGHTIQRLLGGS